MMSAPKTEGFDLAALVQQVALAVSKSGIQPELLNDEQAAALWGVSVRRFHELRDHQWAPKAIPLGPRQLRWARTELVAAIANMPRQVATTEPAQLLRARIQRAKNTGSLAA